MVRGSAAVKRYLILRAAPFGEEAVMVAKTIVKHRVYVVADREPRYDPFTDTYEDIPCQRIEEKFYSDGTVEQHIESLELMTVNY